MLPLLRKEARALGPTALAAIGIIALAATGMREHVVHESLGSGVSLLGLLFGVATLSAHGIGHEFIGSTLPALFMQPVSRGRIFCAKLTAAAGCVAILGAMFYVVMASNPRTPMPAPSLFVLLLAFGVAAGPLLAMLGRTTLAGAVLTIATAAGLWLAAGFAASMYFGFEPVAEADALQAAIFGDALGIAVLAAIAVSWHMFRCLQVVEGRGTSIDIGSWLRWPAPSGTVRGSRARAVRAMLMKELRLQQLSFVLAALFTAGWILFRLLRPHPSSAAVESILMLMYLYFGTVALVAGAVAIADEHQLGTYSTQQLLPWPGWLLWTVKIVMVFAAALVLGAGVPSLLLNTSSLLLRYHGLGVWPPLMDVVFVTACAVYVSSYASNSVNALVGSAAVVAVASYAVRWCQRAAFSTRLSWGLAFADYRHVMDGRRNALLMVALLLLYFAYANDRARERSIARATTHAIVLVAAMFIAFLL